MNPKTPPPLSSPPSEFNFPSWPEDSTAPLPFVLPNFPAPDARQQVSTTQPEADNAPLFSPSAGPSEQDELLPPQSPFGIPLSSLNSSSTFPRKRSRRLLRTLAKISLVFLFAAIGWVGYSEYVSTSGSNPVAEWRTSLFTWLLTEDGAANPPPVEPAAFVAEAAATSIKETAEEKLSSEEATEKELRKKLAEDTGNADLLLSLADNLAVQGRKDEAWLLLAKSTRTGDKRFGSRILTLGLETGKYDETLILLDPESPGAPEWDSNDWITIALLYEKSGNKARALELLRKYDKENIHNSPIAGQ